MYFPIYIKENSQNEYCAGSFDLENCETCANSIDNAVSALRDAIKKQIIQQVTRKKSLSLNLRSLSYYKKTRLPELNQASAKPLLTDVLSVDMNML